MRVDIKRLRDQLKEKELEVPEPDFPLEELEADAAERGKT